MTSLNLRCLHAATGLILGLSLPLASVSAGEAGASEDGRSLMVGSAPRAAEIAAAVEAARDGFRRRRADLQRPTAAQRALIDALDAGIASRSGLRLRFDPRAGAVDLLIMPRSVVGAGSPRAGRDSAAIAADARDVLAPIAPLFRIDDVLDELQLERGWRDATGAEHASFQRRHQGVPVFGHEFRVHKWPDGSLRAVQATPLRADLPGATPEIAAYMAEAGLMADHPGASVTSHGLRYLDTEDGYRLAWLHDVIAGPDQRWWVFTDARSGVELDRLDRVHDAVVTASGVDGNGVAQAFDVWEEGGTFTMIDPTVPRADPPYLLPPGSHSTVGDPAVLDNNNVTFSGQQRYVTSAALASGWDPTAVSANVNSRAVHAYFRDTFGRDSIDDAGMSLVSIVHYGFRVQNAFWNGSQMVYGDGRDDFDSFAHCADIVTHEMTHGVTEFSANLIYRFQSGAISESMSDVFGVMVDRDDWILGEDCARRAPGKMRNMIDPSDGFLVQPAHMDDYYNWSRTQDNGGVHYNSGILNRAAYLLAEGLTDEGSGDSVGRAVTEQLYYRTLTTYLTSSADFLDLRAGMELSAEDLYPGDADVIGAVRDAFDAVGIIDGAVPRPDDRTPTGADPIPGADVMVYLYPQDGSYDSTTEAFDVYIQSIPDPFTGYDPDLDDGPLNDVRSARWTRPAAVTLDEGTYVYFVADDDDVYVVDPDGVRTAVTSSGDISSIAVSPDGTQLVYTTTDEDGEIHHVDLGDATATDYALDEPMLYADSLAFDLRGQRVAFDALVCVDSGESACADGDGVRYWTIGALDLRLDSIEHPFPGQSVDHDLGFPSFAYNSSRVLTFDRVDNSEFDATGEVISSVEVIDLDQGRVVEVFDRGRFDSDGPERWGAASLWGDDDYISLQLPDPVLDTPGVVRLPVDSRWEIDEGDPDDLNDFQIGLPVMHRAAVRDLNVSVSVDETALDFGEVAPSSSTTLGLELSNDGNIDVEVLDVLLTGDAYGHNLVPGWLPRGQSLSVSVTLHAPADAGSVDAMLMIESDGDPATITIPLTAVVGSNGEIGPVSSTATVGEAAGTITVQIARGVGAYGAVSVAYATQAVTASAGVDYTSASGTLEWADGESDTKSIQITINDDQTDEPNEVFNLVLSSPTGGATLAATSQVAITISDDEVTPSGGGGGSPIAILLLLTTLSLRGASRRNGHS